MNMYFYLRIAQHLKTSLKAQCEILLKFSVPKPTWQCQEVLKRASRRVDDEMKITGKKQILFTFRVPRVSKGQLKQLLEHNLYWDSVQQWLIINFYNHSAYWATPKPNNKLVPEAQSLCGGKILHGDGHRTPKTGSNSCNKLG